MAWFRADVDLPKKFSYEKVLFFTQLSHHLMSKLLKKSYILSINHLPYCWCNIRMVPYLNWSAGQVAWVQFSSLPSRQSWSKSQRHFSGIHFSSSRHLNSVGRQFNLLHLKSLSSDLSPQSLFPSHFQLLGIHFPLAQVNWSTLKFKRNHFFIVALKRTKWYFVSKSIELQL